MALTPALAAAYGTMSLVGRTAPVLETLMIEPPPACDHPLADERGEAERALEVDRDDLVEELLGDVGELVVHAARRRRC